MTDNRPNCEINRDRQNRYQKGNAGKSEAQQMEQVEAFVPGHCGLDMAFLQPSKEKEGEIVPYSQEETSRF